MFLHIIADKFHRFHQMTFLLKRDNEKMKFFLMNCYEISNFKPVDVCGEEIFEIPKGFNLNNPACNARKQMNIKR